MHRTLVACALFSSVVSLATLLLLCLTFAYFRAAVPALPEGCNRAYQIQPETGVILEGRVCKLPSLVAPSAAPTRLPAPPSRGA
jgi:hypothetical protein